MQCNYNSFVQIINFHGLFRNVLRCWKTGACRIMVSLDSLRYQGWVLDIGGGGGGYEYPSKMWDYHVSFWADQQKKRGIILLLPSGPGRGSFQQPVPNMTFQHLESTFYTLVVATSVKPRTSFARGTGTTFVKMVCRKLVNIRFKCLTSS